VSSVVHDDIGGSIVVGACAVNECVATGVTGTPLMHMSPTTSNVPSTESVSLAAAATSVVGNDVGGGVFVRAHESPVAITTPFNASRSHVAAALSAVVDDDVGGGVVVGACAVTECVGTVVTGVARVHESPVGANMPSAASLALAAAVWLVVEDVVCGGVGVGSCAHECAVATNTSSSTSLSFAAALSAVVDDYVRGGVVVAAKDVIKCSAIIVTGAALAHVSPVHTTTPSSASLSVATVMSSVFDDNVDGGVYVGSNALITGVAIVVTVAALVHVSPVTGNVLSTASVSLAAPVMQVVRDDVGGAVIVGDFESPVATNT